MKLETLPNHDLVIKARVGDYTDWRPSIADLNIPSKVSFIVDGTFDFLGEIKKIVWNYGDFTKLIVISNRKQKPQSVIVDHIFRQKNTLEINTLSIQASVYTDQNMYVPPAFIIHNIKQKAVNYVDPEEFKSGILAYYKSKACIPDSLAVSVQQIATRLAFAPNFINYCVDEETEALTKRGWLKYSEITKNDEIISYKQETGHLVWSKVTDLFINKNYSGPMHYLTTKGLDSLVSPGHRFLTIKNGLQPVELLKCHDHIIIQGGPVSTIINQMYSNDFVELIGWIVTEGNYIKGKNTHSIQIFQKKGDKADRIKKCLNNLLIDFKEYTWSNPEILCFRFKQDFANLIINLFPEKILTMDFINCLNQEQRLLLIQTMVDGDGWNMKSGTRGFVQKNKKHMDNFIALCTISGLSTSCRLVKQNGPFGYCEYYSAYIYSKTKNTCKIDCIDFHGGRSSPGGTQGKSNHPNIPIVEYTGTIWCPKTEYGNFMARRGKYCYLSGNTYREEMIGDALIKMIEALKGHKFNPEKGKPFSYFTKIAYHAFCNRIKKEKKAREALTHYQNEVYSGLIDDGVIPAEKNTHHVHDENVYVEISTDSE